MLLVFKTDDVWKTKLEKSRRSLLIKREREEKKK